MEQTPQSQLKLLVAKGKEQGYLTYAEVNDHLPQDIVDSDQIEDIIQMINDMGIQVVESVPDADDLLLTENNAADEDAAEAAAILKFTPNVAAAAIGKVLKSAVANAKNNHQLAEEKLFVKACFADEGVVLKRFMPRAKGSATSIFKRTSHITVVVAERN